MKLLNMVRKKEQNNYEWYLTFKKKNLSSIYHLRGILKLNIKYFNYEKHC